MSALECKAEISQGVPTPLAKRQTGKADILRHSATCPLSGQSGHQRTYVVIYKYTPYLQEILPYTYVAAFVTGMVVGAAASRDLERTQAGER